MVKTSEEDDPIAVFTVLNTVGHKDQDWMKQMQSFVANACKDEALKKNLAEVRETGSTVSSIYDEPYLGTGILSIIWLYALSDTLSDISSCGAELYHLQAFAQEGTGLLVNERLINSPPKLAPPLMQFLFEEIKAASQDPSLPKPQREAFKFKRYLIITRVYADNDAPNPAAGPGSSKKQKVGGGLVQS